MLRKHSLFDKTKLFVSKEEAGLLISFTTLIIKLMIVNRMQQATFVRILLICFDHISNRSHPSLHPDQVKWWTSNCLPTGRFRPFSTGESWNNTNMMMIFDSDLFYYLFLYFWVCFDRSRLSRVEWKGEGSTRYTAAAKIKILRDGISRNTFRCAEILPTGSKYHSVKYKNRPK